MPVKSYNPTTPGVRQMTRDTFEDITRTTPEKSLTYFRKEHAGRNNTGKLTVRHRGGGHKQRVRIIDFKGQDKAGITAVVSTVEYDPNRSAYIMLLQYPDGEKRYQLAPVDIKVGMIIETKAKCKVQTGNRMQLKNIPVGYSVYNVELQPGRGGQMAKTAGSFARLVSLEGPKAQIQLPSGEIRLVEKKCFASIGIVSNVDHSNIKIGKAGRNRWLGKRPQVRGKAMNPVDHPHGGGEGGSSIGLKAPKTPWGLPALGVKTRHRKDSNKFIVKSRHSHK